MLVRALAQTAPLWEPIRLCYWWVHRAARILKNEEGLRVEELRRDYRRLLAEMGDRREEAAELQGAVSLFLKVTKSYWKGCSTAIASLKGPCPALTTTWSTSSDRHAMANGVPAAEGTPRPRWW